MSLMKPLVMTEACPAARRPAHSAGARGPRSARGLLMQRMEDSSLRQLLRLTQASANLRQGALTPTNKKNEGRSEEVIENTGPHDIMSAENSDFVCEITEINANCTTFSRFLMTFSRICVQKTQTMRKPDTADLPFSRHPLPFHLHKGVTFTRPGATRPVLRWHYGHSALCPDVLNYFHKTSKQKAGQAQRGRDR